MTFLEPIHAAFQLLIHHCCLDGVLWLCIPAVSRLDLQATAGATGSLAAVMSTWIHVNMDSWQCPIFPGIREIWRLNAAVRLMS